METKAREARKTINALDGVGRNPLLRGTPEGALSFKEAAKMNCNCRPSTPLEVPPELIQRAKDLVKDKKQATRHLAACIILYLLILLAMFGSILLTPKKAHAQVIPAPALGYSIDTLADSIYLAEGGAKTSHPYGILAHYKHTTPRQACINTIRHALRDWDGNGDFLQFLANRYAPLGCSNDNGTNKYWLKNVRYFLNKAKYE